MQKISSNRSFGIVFFVVFIIIALWPLINSGPIRIWPLPFSLIFLILGIINSKLLTPLNRLWAKFGIFLGKVIAPTVMAIVFFGIITPIGILMKLIGKDLVGRKFLNTKTYWIKRDKDVGTMKRQF